MKGIEVTQSVKRMKKGLILLGESENFVILYSVWKIVSAYVEHILIISDQGKKIGLKQLTIQLRFSKVPMTSKSSKLTQSV